MKNFKLDEVIEDFRKISLELVALELSIEKCDNKCYLPYITNLHQKLCEDCSETYLKIGMIKTIMRKMSRSCND